MINYFVTIKIISLKLKKNTKIIFRSQVNICILKNREKLTYDVYIRYRRPFMFNYQCMLYFSYG